MSIDNNLEENNGLEENQTEEQRDLNSNEGGKKISGSKITGATLLFALLGVCFCWLAWHFYFSKMFFFQEQKPKEDTGTRHWQSAPSSLGKFEPPKLELPKVEEPPPPPPPAPEKVEEPKAPEPPPEEPKPDPMAVLKAKRLGASVKTQNYEPTPKKEEKKEEKKEVVQSRQVKIMKNMDFTLIKGTKIPCTVETTIISEQQGFTSCIITQDVFSGNGRVVLIEKGTKVTGEYRGGTVKNGDRRLQIIWDRLITPYDIVVQLDSPSTDRLGASGVTGKVDNRWMTRIGSALLVSLITDALEIQKDKHKNTQVVVESETAETGEDIATTILENNINLPPIIYIKEGGVINIFVADDIDLSSVYKVRAMARPQQIILPNRAVFFD